MVLSTQEERRRMMDFNPKITMQPSERELAAHAESTPVSGDAVVKALYGKSATASVIGGRLVAHVNGQMYPTAFVQKTHATRP